MADTTSQNAVPQTVATGNISYSNIVQAKTTHTCSVARPQGVTTTTTTETSQTVTAATETRFQTIENEQQSLKQHLSRAEQRTVSTDENI
jgi:hypothetical protein